MPKLGLDEQKSDTRLAAVSNAAMDVDAQYSFGTVASRSGGAQVRLSHFFAREKTRKYAKTGVSKHFQRPLLSEGLTKLISIVSNILLFRVLSRVSRAFSKWEKCESRTKITVLHPNLGKPCIVYTYRYVSASIDNYQPSGGSLSVAACRVFRK